MRSILAGLAGFITLGGLALSLGGTAHARGAGLLVPDWALVSEQTEVRHARVHRWAYNLAGKPVDVHAVCTGNAVARARSYRTGKDIAYSIFSLGWYTPKTVEVTCIK